MLEPRPNISPVAVIPPPENPETRTQPAKAKASAIIFRLVIFSWKSTADISIIQMGEVYRSIAAVESGIIVMAEK